MFFFLRSWTWCDVTIITVAVQWRDPPHFVKGKERKALGYIQPLLKFRFSTFKWPVLDCLYRHTQTYSQPVLTGQMRCVVVVFFFFLLSKGASCVPCHMECGCGLCPAKHNERASPHTRTHEPTNPNPSVLCFYAQPLCVWLTQDSAELSAPSEGHVRGKELPASAARFQSQTRSLRPCVFRGFLRTKYCTTT